MPRNAYVLLTLTTLFWGGNAIAGKLAIGHISPMLLGTARWAVALILFLPFAWGSLRQDRHALRPALPGLVGLAFLGFTLFNVGLYGALQFTTAINVSVEQAGMPMLIFLLNFLMFRTRVVVLQIVGLVLSVAGVALTASHGEPARLLALDVNAGDAIMLLALVSYSVYTVLLRFRPPLRWQTLMLVLFAAGAATSAPFAVAEFALGFGTWPDARGLAILAYVVVFPSILAQIFYIRAVELIGGNRAGLFINLVPVFGTLLSIAILGEAFHTYHALALLLVFGGIWMAEHGGRRAA